MITRSLSIICMYLLLWSMWFLIQIKSISLTSHSHRSPIAHWNCRSEWEHCTHGYYSAKTGLHVLQSCMTHFSPLALYLFKPTQVWNLIRDELLPGGGQGYMWYQWMTHFKLDNTPLFSERFWKWDHVRMRWVRVHNGYSMT